MSIKELLLQEIDSSSDIILAETLNFLRFLKTKETQTQPKSKVSEFTNHAPVNSTGRSLLEHLKTIGQWEGDDLQECLQLVYATRVKEGSYAGGRWQKAIKMGIQTPSY